MNLTAKVRPAWKRLLGPDPWPVRRIVGEVLLLSAVTLIAFGVHRLSTGPGGGRVAGLVALLCLVMACLRRALPATVLLLTAVGASPLGGVSALLPLAGWSAGRRIPQAWRAAGIFVVALVLDLLAGLVTVLTTAGSNRWVSMTFLNGLWFSALVIVPGLVARYLSQRRTLLAALRNQHRQLLRENAIIAREAQLRERQRIAQDMHDSLGHQLTLIAVHTGALQVDSELTGRHREAVGVLRDASVTAMRELREVVGVLREEPEAPAARAGSPVAAPPAEGAAAPSDGVPRVGASASGAPGAAVPAAEAAAGALGASPAPPARDAQSPTRDDAEPSAVRSPGGASAPVPGTGVVAGAAEVAALVEASRAAGAEVRLRCDGERRELPPAADRAAYRVVQEGLTNAHKHAPGASISVALAFEPDSLLVEVVNGPVPPGGARGPGVSGGRGLAGLAERARLAGGMLHRGPHGDGGFRLAAVLPYEAAGSADRPPRSEPAARGPAPAPPLTEPVTGGEAPLAPDLRYEEFDLLLKRRRTGCFAWGCGIGVIALIVTGVGLVWGAVLVMDELEKSIVEPDDYAAIEVGRPEREVREQLPDGDSLLTSSLGANEPPVPEGSECLRLISSEPASSWEKDIVFRFCFADGRLVEKKRFESQL